MTAKEFKEKHPHLAHLEGDDLWNAMEMAVLKEQPPREKLPDDDEIGEVVERDGYTFTFSKGAIRSLEEMFPPQEGPKFENLGIFIPQDAVTFQADPAKVPHIIHRGDEFEAVAKNCTNCKHYLSFRDAYEDDQEPDEYGWCKHPQSDGYSRPPDRENDETIGVDFVCTKHEYNG